ncbi:NUDIX hydrolase [uncultured Winogradskyella sp.]|uniref:NUDIX hydrolase n=1 Tax=uncultured Winogradskyella sp. TaxID=395353 RepID=UPI002624CDD5|nr:NUDIX domain-containing protein [uncultured Winogradskyella sp.]
MEEYIKKVKDERKFKGKLLEIIDREFELSKNGKIDNFTIEIARRPPGVRLIIIKEDKILLTKEFRSELEDWDYRVAGGKIYESLTEYLKFVDDKNAVKEKSIEAVKNEGLEEAGIIAKNQELIYISKSGATMEWDLYYYIVDEFEMASKGNETEFAEIIYPEWFSLKEAKAMCLDGRIKEDRTVGILLKYILNKENAR